MANTSYDFRDFKYDPSSFNANAFTAPIASNLYSNIFGSSAPSYDFSAYKFEPVFSSEQITKSFTPSTQERSTGVDWLDTLGKGLEALNKARSYQASKSESSLDKYLKSGAGNTNLAGQGRSWRMYQPSPRQKTTQTGGGGGIGGAVGTIAGIGASFIPGLGPGIAAAMPAIGGSLGSLFG